MPEEQKQAEPKKKRVEAEWELFTKIVLPKNCGEVQRRDMRRAFYTGASAFMSIVMDFLDPGTEATDADVQRMDEIYRELLEFGENVKKSAA